MSAELDELTVNYEEEGRLVRKELERVFLSKGAWATVLFRYQELDPKTENYRAPKAMIVRFRKVKGVYRKQTSFNFSSPKQALAIAEILQKWFANAPESEVESEEEHAS
ncbi:hypothetical protein KKD52_12660 [Myxococcota bacterium]|jgi:hypothetical protein|nr:hypothetical protein [Myxococcota bacterium]PKN27517.1 MAG: hypothetical protein CVU65_02165 [Deltaproteobacteria bacterium HGW-Deltaproteobacteria-22]PKN44487.1 MAG: hypothetical protein CVU59_11535 [Deltaproteobacteria bacterium HGW-Deltaproteobacteria-17]MBU1244900.1 hypothetical protein [Myxococcota bacterium]MBU1412906.1 hypothetical protein [Myxococcota bacterium]